MRKRFRIGYFMVGLLLSFALCLTACKEDTEQVNDDCEHIYDDCADIECNECGEIRESNHSWIEADCNNP